MSVKKLHLQRHREGLRPYRQKNEQHRQKHTEYEQAKKKGKGNTEGNGGKKMVESL